MPNLNFTKQSWNEGTSLSSDSFAYTASIHIMLSPHPAKRSVPDPVDIAKQIRRDAKLCESETGRPSLLAFRLPPSSSPQALDIATHLVPSPDLPADIKRLVYDNLVTRIQKNTIFNRRKPDLGEKEPAGNESSENAREPTLHESELATAARVLRHLTAWSDVRLECTVGDAMAEIERRLKNSAEEPLHEKPESRATFPTTSETIRKLREAALKGHATQKRLCYICRSRFSVPHQSYPALCQPCGAFNLANSNLSLPPALNLIGKTALVTGGRVNLGYHTALRLLRCGASVIVSSRYPRDAATRYAAEPDSRAWESKLKVVGADFRAARDAFQLVARVKGILADWGESRLHILVNNAAQTLTDSVPKEQSAIHRENLLEGQAGASPFMVEHTYQARIRGGTLFTLDNKTEPQLLTLPTIPYLPGGGVTTTAETTTLSNPTPKSSWSQTLPEIPYEDILTAHAINTFVPLILIRELLPSMASSSSHALTPEAYIINVSSREGIFEDNKPNTPKRGHHVHTNMSKAALNMITETEAASAWRAGRVAMCTVDPGYMSAAPECEGRFGGTRPIGWEDGAARVLWPVAVGVREGRPVWGKFLKHFGTVEVDSGNGR